MTRQRFDLLKFTIAGLFLLVAVLASAQSQTPAELPFPGYPSEKDLPPKVMGRFTFVCVGKDKAPAGYIEGARLYGTDVYTDDSGICAAAVHAGKITFESGGTVTIETVAGQQEYKGSTRNGVTSATWTHGSLRSFVVISGDSVGTPPVPPSNSAPPGQIPCDWTGTWKVNNELFSFRQTVGLPLGQTAVTQISGAGITDPSWRLTGTVQGNVLTGQWSNSKDSGKIRISIGQDCNSFSSSWGVGDNSTSFSATGTRTTEEGSNQSGNPGKSSKGCTGFDGHWDATYGPLTITVSGSRAEGSYLYYDRTDHITGTVTGKIFEGEWIEPQRRGRLHLELYEDGNSFQGTWWDEKGSMGGGWYGTCNSSR